MVWSAIKSSLEASLPKSEFNLWIKPLECQFVNDQNLDLIGPDRFFCAWVEDRYLQLIQDIAQKMGVKGGIRLQAGPQKPLQVAPPHPSGQLRLPGIEDVQSRYRSLHPAFTFDEFMVGESNMLAQSACHALAVGDRTYGNCLFMNSSTGLGKSHLTQAVVHKILDVAPGTKLQYLTAQQFSADMVQNLKNNTMDLFSRKYLNSCEILLVEDIHTLIGKNKTQEELNTILDYLIKSGQRVILTSALSPKKLKGLDEDFRSRMTSGLVTDIESPDFDTRARIIEHKVNVNNLKMSKKLIEHLADKLKGDIRKIESAILGIKAKSCVRKKAPDAALINEVLGSLVENSADINAETIRDLIGRQFKVTTEELRSRSRKRAITYPRQIGMYLTRKYTKESLADIGNMYNRDHSTVLYAIKVITRDMSQKSGTKQQVEMLCEKLKS
ncbi:chromosomal replication initiator protein DnaA [Desulfogranum japonicum]|uniref:chromosomal replication initiator protein DnaA n=1 Tax=Desulfogranum japonicum TaxID=231447 RepID=UPI000405AA76|nr:chromosomal replication initiator protein DnaA [Desulfogranum japonicum]